METYFFISATLPYNRSFVNAKRPVKLKLKTELVILRYNSFKREDFAMTQIHKAFSTQQVKYLLKRCLDKQT